MVGEDATKWKFWEELGYSVCLMGSTLLLSYGMSRP